MIKKRKAAALITACIIAVFLGIVGILFAFRSIQERNLATRYVDSVRAFWLAEAGLAKGYNELMSSPSYNGESWTTLANGDYRVVKNITADGVEIRAEGRYGSSTHALTSTLAIVPYPFENTISAGDDIHLSGTQAKVKVYGKTRLSGDYTEEGQDGSNIWFADKQAGIDSSYTNFVIPDYDNNGTPDEFNDFVTLGRESIADYPRKKTVYIQTNGMVNIFPTKKLGNKKIIFVEGDEEGTGDVYIYFDASWRNSQDITIISTGDITYVQPLQIQKDARLNTISWDDYNEISTFYSTHESVLYAHDDIYYRDTFGYGSVTGNIIAGDDIRFTHTYNDKNFYYSDRAYNGDVPPGFGRIAAGSGVLSSQIEDWQETYD